MKKLHLSLIPAALICFHLEDISAQTDTKEEQRPIEYSVSERGANHRVWQSVRTEASQSDTVYSITNKYTEIATGMHFRKDGEWMEAEAKIEITPDGASASKGQHKVNFAPNINSVGAIDMVTSDEKRLRSHVIGISYYDTASGKSVLIAEIKDSIGVLQPPNQVIYEDAFTDFKADLRYTYTLAGFEQDLILRAQPPSPSDYGLDPATTRLQLLTEFMDPPVPTKEQINKEGVQVDRTLNFGAMQIGMGKAFLIGNEEQAKGQITVDKSWRKLDGRDFLIEELGFKRVEKLLEALPAAPQAGVRPTQDKIRHVVSNRRLLPQRKEAKASTKEPIRIAGLFSEKIGLVMDYSIMSRQTNFTFKGDMTYYVTNTVNLSSNTVIEGGTVIKYKNTGQINLFGSIDCKTYPYRPAIFTSKDDNSVGEVISGSTGNPTNCYGTGFNLSVDANLKYLRFTHLALPFYVGYNCDLVLTNCQFVHCSIVFLTDDNTSLKLKNVLVTSCPDLLYADGNDPEVSAENVTVHNCSNLASAGNFHMTNTLLVAVTTIYAYYNATNSNFIWLTNDPGVFQTVGAGSHYLATNSIYRNVGTTNINVDVLADLRTKTTYPPIVYSNATISAETTLNPQAQRDTDVPDLGYHYDPLDYVFGGALANENLTFTAGTAVGWFWPSSGSGVGYGLNMGDTKIVNFDGRVDAYNYWVRYNTVQEGGNGLWTTSSGVGGLTGTANIYLEDVGLSPEVWMRFTRCSMLDDPGYCHFRDNYGYLTVRAVHCEFLGGNLGAYAVGYYLTNCLVERAGVGAGEGWPGNEFHLRNCTFHGGFLQVTPSYMQIPASIKDCAFDGTAISTSYYRWDEDLQDYVLDLSSFDFDYNSFITGADRTDPQGGNDVIVTNFNWQISWLGNYYVWTNSPLLNAGSLTNAGWAGLYHFTMTTNQVKETNSLLDIGYHYVAVTNGIPIDTDDDGTPDYVEDSNGNGVVNSGETDWADPFDLGLRVLITRPKNNSIIP